MNGGVAQMNTTTQQEQPSIQPLWLTYPEAQRLTGLGRTTLSTIVNSGKVKAARVGRAVRINRESLERFMETHAIQPKLPGFNDITS
jgi:excisionase family DNA binding protein